MIPGHPRASRESRGRGAPPYPVSLQPHSPSLPSTWHLQAPLRVGMGMHLGELWLPGPVRVTVLLPSFAPCSSLAPPLWRPQCRCMWLRSWFDSAVPTPQWTCSGLPRRLGVPTQGLRTSGRGRSYVHTPNVCSVGQLGAAEVWGMHALHVLGRAPSFLLPQQQGTGFHDPSSVAGLVWGCFH